MTEVAIREERLPAINDAELTIEQLSGQVQKVQQAMRAVMHEGTHYGTIPGTPKPTLFKPGAEKLCLLFRLAPDYEIVETMDGDHYTARVTCRLTHSPSGNFVGSGEGLCTTKESRYALRKQNRVCPACGGEFIIKGKAEYGGGWICFRKKGGCGTKFDDGDAVIESQVEGDIPNDKLADTYNTVLKMACKRALVAGVLNVTAASDIFTQDLEDSPQASATSAEPSSGTPQPGSQENYEALLNALMENRDEPRVWTESVVLVNANRHFGRKIDTLQDLTDDEMLSIIQAATQWRADNPIESVVADAVEDPNPVDPEEDA